MTDTINFSRRNLLKGGGALLIGFSLAGAGVEEAASTTRAAFAAPRDLKQVDSWIAINADNTATLFLGKSELGQGITTGLLQIAGEELDLGMNQMSAALLDTYMSPRQAPTVASLGITQGGPQIRAAAAEARQALLALAAAKLEVPASELSVANGVVSVKSDARRAVKYGELLGDKPFNVAFTGKAPVKPVSEYQLVGKPVARVDLPAKIRGTYTYMQHVRVPNMLHGRVVRPQGQGAYGADAKVVSIDESSIKDIVGAKVVRKGNFVGVVAPTEWDSVQAAHKLKVQWDAPAVLPGNGGVHAKMRSDTTIDTVVDQAGDIDAAFGSAAHVVAGTFQAPYQAQAPFGPNCALADVSADKALVMCSTQDVFKTAELVAKVVGLTPQQVRVQYYEGSGTFGHSAYHDVAQAAAIMSQEIGKPVRVQLMRADEHGYGNYGPAQLSDVRAAVDANGKLVAFEFQSWQHCWIDNETSELLALGTKAKERTGRLSMTVRPTICSMYDVASRKLINHQVSGLAGYLRGSYLRSPLDTGFCFAAEQMIDEVALAAGIDPLEFRRKNMRDPRWIAVLNAAGEAAKWVPRPTRERPMRDVMTGSGVAVGGHYADNYAAAVAEVEVNRATGKVVVKKIFGAMDTGLAINPAVVETQMIGMMTQATSRVLKEEVTFSNTNVTSLDWNSYPILRFSEHPTVTPILLQRLEQPPAGAGENLMGPTAAAIANAFFDATGIRMKEYPLTPERVKAALTRRA